MKFYLMVTDDEGTRAVLDGQTMTPICLDSLEEAREFMLEGANYFGVEARETGYIDADGTEYPMMLEFDRADGSNFFLVPNVPQKRNWKRVISNLQGVIFCVEDKGLFITTFEPNA